MKQYRKANKEKIAKQQKEYDKQYKKQYRETHKEEIKEGKKRYYKTNKEKINEKGKQYYQTHKEEIKQHNKQYYRENREERNKYNRQYQKTHREEINKYIKEKRKKPEILLNHRFSTAIWKSLKRKGSSKKGYSWEKIIGYTTQDLMEHLEKQFKDGMSWDNRGKWHVDHIKPVSSFDFTSYEDDEFQECWALKNLQPLWAEENLKKGKKIILILNPCLIS